MKIGFIGLGHMGNPMASNLVKAGFDVTVFDVIPESIEALVAKGAAKAMSVAELAKDKDMIITMVQTGKQVEAICLPEEGVFNHLKTDALYVDCSSIDIEASKALHKIAKERGIAMLDSPVSGGVAGAEAGTLTLMVGGDVEYFNKAKPVLQKIGKNVIHAGGAGTGQVAKICNNMLLAISMIGVSEAFSLAEREGLDAKKFFEISSNSSGQCWSMTSYCPAPGVMENVPSSNGYAPGFMAKMMVKDLHLAKHAAKSTNASTPMGTLATQLYEEFVNQGHGDMDFSGIINMFSD